MAKLYDILFLVSGAASAAWGHGTVQAAARIMTGASPAPRERRPQASPFPTDNRLRDDIGLPPLAADPPALMRRPTLPPPPYFPADDRLRDDIGLPPLTRRS